MKRITLVITVAGMAAMLSPALAETSQERTLKAPEKTMGDHGTLPATEKMGKKIPDMAGPKTAESPATESGAASGPKGPPKRMGDEGTLPATGKMGARVPDMGADN